MIGVAGPPYTPLLSRAVANSSSGNVSINNTAFGPLSASNGPFTVAFWFKSSDLTPAPSYIMEELRRGFGAQWSVIYGYAPQQIEFYTGNAVVRQNSGIAVTGWRMASYRLP